MAVATVARRAAQSAVPRRTRRTTGVPRVQIRRDLRTGDTKPAITAMVIVTGVEFLNAWLVEKRTLPTRRELVQLAVLGFMLALLTEVTPKLGKSMSYLVMTAVIFDRSQKILKALDTGNVKADVEREPLPDALAVPGPTTTVLYSTGGPAAMTPPVPQRVLLRRPQRGVGTAI